MDNIEDAIIVYIDALSEINRTLDKLNFEYHAAKTDDERNRISIIITILENQYKIKEREYHNLLHEKPIRLEKKQKTS